GPHRPPRHRLLQPAARRERREPPRARRRVRVARRGGGRREDQPLRAAPRLHDRQRRGLGYGDRAGWIAHADPARRTVADLADWDPRRFYERQDELSGVYSGAVTERHRAKASLVEGYCGATSRGLELGAGGGQTAVATAELGFDIVAIELVPRLAAHARALAARIGARVEVLEGDFYEVSVEGPFGAVCYWDGFGVGTGADQQG